MINTNILQCYSLVFFSLLAEFDTQLPLFTSISKPEKTRVFPGFKFWKPEKSGFWKSPRIGNPSWNSMKNQRKAKKFIYVLVQIYFYSASFGLKMVQKFSKTSQLLIGSEKLTASDCFLEYRAFLWWKVRIFTI